MAINPRSSAAALQRSKLQGSKTAPKTSTVVRDAAPNVARPKRVSENISGTGTLAQPEREQERLAAIERSSGNKIYTSDTELKLALSDGTITQSQYEAAADRIRQGFEGVDPLGFNADKVLDQVGKTKFDPALSPSGQAAQRMDVAGEIEKMGEIDKSAFDRLVKTGMTEQQAIEKIKGLRPEIQKTTSGVYSNVNTKQINELKSSMSNPIMTTSKSGRPAVDRKATQERDSKIQEEIRLLEREEEKEKKEAAEEQKEVETDIEEKQVTVTEDPYETQLSDDLSSAQTNIASMLALAQGDPALFQATASRLVGMQNSVKGLQNLLADFRSSQPTDAELESPLDSIPELKRQQLDELKIAETNAAILEENARINRDLQSAQKELIEMRNRQQERKKTQQNVEQERILRTRMNRLGIETDTGALDHLQSKIREMDTELSELENANDIEELMVNIEVERRFDNELRGITNKYDSDRLTINKTYNSAIAEIRDSVNKSKAEKAKDYAKEAKDIGLKIAELDLKYGDAIAESLNTMRKDRADQEKEMFDRKIDVWNSAMDVIDVWGTNNPQLLASFESDLGLPIGTLSRVKTTKELKSVGDGISMASEVNQRYQELLEEAALNGEDITPSKKTSLKIRAQAEIGRKYAPKTQEDLISHVEQLMEDGYTADEAFLAIQQSGNNYVLPEEDPRGIDTLESVYGKSISPALLGGGSVQLLGGSLVPADEDILSLWDYVTRGEFSKAVEVKRPVEPAPLAKQFKAPFQTK